MLWCLRRRLGRMKKRKLVDEAQLVEFFYLLFLIY